MWSRTIDGVLTVSFDLAERVRTLAVPGAPCVVNGKTFTLSDAMDLERTGAHERMWFYTEEGTHALSLNFCANEQLYEIVFLERVPLWIFGTHERVVPITSLTFPQAECTVFAQPTT